MKGPVRSGGPAESQQATAYWTTGPGEGELRAEPVGPHDSESEIGPATSTEDEAVTVETLYSGLSRGTESLVHHGRVPRSEHQRMRAPFQNGDFPFPVKYGYMAVGRVSEGPADLVRRIVFSLHPHQDRFSLPRKSVTLVPDDVPPKRAVLAANMETAINVLWDGQPGVGDSITIVGAGTVGLLVGYLAERIPGTEVMLVDVDPGRARVADALGIPFRLGEPPRDASSDLVIHTSGSPQGLAASLRAAGPEARCVEASWYGDRDVPVALGAAFHSQRLELRSSQVGSIPARRARRWSHGRRLGLALRLLADDCLDALISSVDPFESMPEKVPARLSSQDTLCAVFEYPAGRP